MPRGRELRPANLLAAGQVTHGVCRPRLTVEAGFETDFHGDHAGDPLTFFGLSFEPVTERLLAALECESLQRHRFHILSQARRAIFKYIEGWYNRHRRWHEFPSDKLSTKPGQVQYLLQETPDARQRYRTIGF